MLLVPEDKEHLYKFEIIITIIIIVIIMMIRIILYAISLDNTWCIVPSISTGTIKSALWTGCNKTKNTLHEIHDQDLVTWWYYFVGQVFCVWEAARSKKANFEFLKMFLLDSVAWQNSQHFAMSLMVPPKNVWGMIAEIWYWWCLTIQTLEVLLIDWLKQIFIQQ